VRLLARLLALLLVPLAFIWHTAAPAAAHDLPGCGGKHQLRGDPWQESSVFLHDDSWWTPEVTWVQVIHHATLGYWFCPNGNRPAKIRETWIDWCWLMPGAEKHRMFAGTVENAWIWDASGAPRNPPPIAIPDDGTRQNCRTQKVSGRFDWWRSMAAEPRWRAWWKIVINNDPDQDGPFLTSGGERTNYIRPLHSVRLSEWHR
jgi:hypothetical protein